MIRCRTTLTRTALLVTLTCSAAATAETPPGGLSRSFHLPAVFVENQGQWDDAAKFVVRLGGVTARLETDGIVLPQLEFFKLPDSPLRLIFEKVRSCQAIRF